MQVKTLEQIIEDCDLELAKSIIDRDQFINWKRNDVTIRLLSECARATLEAFVDDKDSLLESVDTVALRAAYIKGLLYAFDLVIEWRPSEIESDD